MLFGKKQSSYDDQAFETIKKALDEIGWKYDANEEDKSVKLQVNGEDLTLDFMIFVREQQNIVQILSPLPFTVSKDKYEIMARATCFATSRLIDGAFDFHENSGKIFFRMTSCYRGMGMGTERFKYMIHTACHTVDNYNDKLLMVANGMLSLDKFMHPDAQ